MTFHWCALTHMNNVTGHRLRRNDRLVHSRALVQPTTRIGLHSLWFIHKTLDARAFETSNCYDGFTNAFLFVSLCLSLSLSHILSWILSFLSHVLSVSGISAQERLLFCSALRFSYIYPFLICTERPLLYSRDFICHYARFKRFVFNSARSVTRAWSRALRSLARRYLLPSRVSADRVVKCKS